MTAASDIIILLKKNILVNRDYSQFCNLFEFFLIFRSSVFKLCIRRKEHHLDLTCCAVTLFGNYALSLLNRIFFLNNLSVPVQEKNYVCILLYRTRTAKLRKIRLLTFCITRNLTKRNNRNFKFTGKSLKGF